MQIRSNSLDYPALNGRVLDHELRPVPAATVTVAETGTQVTADANGQFAIAGLAFGAYTLAGVRDRAAGPASKPSSTPRTARSTTFS